MINEEYLDVYFSCFPAYFESNWQSHREHFKQLIAHGRIDKQQISAALCTLDFSWKQRAEQGDFFLYEDDKTEEDIKIDYMLLTWDILFPEDILSPMLLKRLKIKVVELLRRNIENSKSFHVDDIIRDLNEEEEWMEVSRFDLLYMRQEIGRREILLEYYVPELWFFKLTPDRGFRSLKEQVLLS